MIHDHSYYFGYVISYIILIIIIILIEFYRKRDKFFDFFTIANLYFLISYVIIPLYLLLKPNYLIASDINNNEQILWTTIVGYFSLFAGWTFFSSSKKKYLISEYSYNYSKLLKIVKYGFSITLISTLIYLLNLGGLRQALISGTLMRYGFMEREIGVFAFVKNIISMAPLITCLLFSFHLNRYLNVCNKKIKALYSFSLLVTIIIIIVGASRGAFVDLLLLHLLIYIRDKEKINFKIMTIISAFTLIIIQFGKQFFFALAMMFNGKNFLQEFTYLNKMRGESEFSIFERIIKEFTHPVLSLDKILDLPVNLINFTYYRDFFWAILRIFPQRIVSIFVDRPETISFTNTVMVQNFEAASLPPGIIAHFYYSFGSIGVAAGMLVYGLLGRKFNDFLLRQSYFNKTFNVFFALFALTYGGFISNGDPNVYIYSILWPLFFLLIFLGKKRMEFYKASAQSNFS